MVLSTNLPGRRKKTERLIFRGRPTNSVLSEGVEDRGGDRGMVEGTREGGGGGAGVGE